MQGLRDFGNALVVAILSIGLTVGALSISLVEFVPEAAPSATSNLLPSPAPVTATLTLLPTPIPTLGLESPTPSITPTFTNTVTPPASCPPPFGWGQITIQAGDTLDSIAARYRVSKDELRSANCLLSDSLIIGSRLYVPPAPTSTFVVCIPGAVGWVNNYIVQPGDTLYRIGYNHYTTLAWMRQINCRLSDTIYPGDRLWVPNVATRTPSPTIGAGVTTYPTLNPTETPITPTATPTPTDQPTNTPVTPTSTTPPTNTPEPSLTPSPTAFPT